MAVVYVKASPGRDFKTYSTTPVLRGDQCSELLIGHPIGLSAVTTALPKPLTPSLKDFVAILNVPSSRLISPTGLTRRMSAVSSLLKKAEGIKRFAYVADVTSLHCASANPPRLTLRTKYNPRRKRRQNAQPCARASACACPATAAKYLRRGDLFLLFLSR